jgi:hypothetical protein
MNRETKREDKKRGDKRGEKRREHSLPLLLCVFSAMNWLSN